jgi:hypothetical protein
VDKLADYPGQQLLPHWLALTAAKKEKLILIVLLD